MMNVGKEIIVTVNKTLRNIYKQLQLSKEKQTSPIASIFIDNGNHLNNFNIFETVFRVIYRYKFPTTPGASTGYRHDIIGYRR